MKTKRDFILYINPNKSPPKVKTLNNERENMLKKISAQTLIENPLIRKAFQNEKKIYLNRIKKGLKSDHIKIDKQMSDSDIKIHTKINEIRELIYDLDKDENKKELEDIAKENMLFKKRYNKVKKEKNKLNQGNYLDFPAFFDICNKYIKKNIKIPNLSEEHNLFSGNPLILTGNELENYIVNNLGDKTKGVQFLERLDDYIEQKIKGNNKISIKEMERIEKLKSEEKPKGYIPPEIEIPMLKDDITNCENSFKNIGELEEFFKPQKNKFSVLTLKKNNSSINTFNNNLEKSPRTNFMRKITSNFSSDNIFQNNISITATTSIGITRKSSPKMPNKNNVLNFNNIGLNLSKDNHFKLPKLDSPSRTPLNFLNNSNYKSNNAINIKKIHFNNSKNLKIDTKLISRNNSLSPIFNSNQNNAIEFSNRLNKLGDKNKIYKLLKLSNQQSNNDNKKENLCPPTETDVEENFELKKEMEKNKETKEIKEKQEKEVKEEKEEIEENIHIKNKEINDKENKEEKNKENNENEEEKGENNIKNKKYKKILFNVYPNKKERKSKMEKVNIENSKNNMNPKIKRKNFINLKMPQIHLNKFNNYKEFECKSFDELEIIPKEEQFNKLEYFFNIVKEDNLNNLKNETKKDIESYFDLKGKDVKKSLTARASYERIHNLMKQSKERNIILEEYIIRNRFNAKNSLTTEQKFILDKNSTFIKEMIKQQTKINEIIFKGDIKQK